METDKLMELLIEECSYAPEYKLSDERFTEILEEYRLDESEVLSLMMENENLVRLYNGWIYTG